MKHALEKESAKALIRHLEDQMNKDQFLNAAVVCVQIQNIMHNLLSKELKEEIKLRDKL